LSSLNPSSVMYFSVFVLRISLAKPRPFRDLTSPKNPKRQKKPKSPVATVFKVKEKLVLYRELKAQVPVIVLVQVNKYIPQGSTPSIVSIFYFFI